MNLFNSLSLLIKFKRWTHLIKWMVCKCHKETTCKCRCSPTWCPIKCTWCNNSRWTRWTWVSPRMLNISSRVISTTNKLVNKERMRSTTNTKPRDADISKHTKTVCLAKSAISHTGMPSLESLMMPSPRRPWTSPSNQSNGTIATKAVAEAAAWVADVAVAWTEAEAALEADNKTQMEEAEVEMEMETKEASTTILEGAVMVSNIILGEAIQDRCLEVAQTRWEIPWMAVSNHKTETWLQKEFKEVLQITKLSCADTSNFVSKTNFYFISISRRILQIRKQVLIRSRRTWTQTIQIR